MAKSISYNPANADSIVAAVLKSLSPDFYNHPVNFKKSKAEKSKAVDTFKKYKKLLELSSTDTTEERQQKAKLRKDAHVVFLRPAPFLLGFISQEGRDGKWQEEKTLAVRAYVEEEFNDLNDVIARGNLEKLLLSITFNEVDNIAEQGFILLAQDGSKQAEALKMLDKQAKEIEKLKQELEETKALLATANKTIESFYEKAGEPES